MEQQIIEVHSGKINGCDQNKKENENILKKIIKLIEKKLIYNVG